MNRKLSLTQHLFLLSAVATLVACGSGSASNDVVCTTEARASVILTVVDAQNKALSNVNVSYTVNNSALKTQQCDAAGVCVLEYEVLGDFSIEASKPSYISASANVKVSKSACHVDTQQISLVLKPS